MAKKPAQSGSQSGGNSSHKHLSTTEKSTGSPLSQKFASSGNPEKSSEISSLIADSHRKSRFATLSRIIQSRPALDRHPPVKLGDFLPDWFEKNIAKPGILLTDLVEIWKTELPDQLVNASTLAGIHRGSLLVYIKSAAAKSEIDSRLRSHLLAKIQLRTRGTVRRVKTVVNRMKADG